jgi:acyl-CoA synthetase (AMP-forming)/AMP-acid ligase II
MIAIAMKTPPARSLHDIEAVEASSHWLPEGVHCTYDLLRAGAELNPDAPALSFFMRAQDHTRPVRWTHRQWLARITQTANLLRRLGIERGDVVAYVLPNLPETHWVIWGGETAGIALALNPLLEGPALRELMTAANARWLVTLAPTPGTELWQQVSAVAEQVPSLRGVLTVSPLGHLPGVAGVALSTLARWRMPKRIGRLPVLNFHSELAREPQDMLSFAAPNLDDVASYFCTGGTTGMPKIAVRRHRTEIANARQLANTFGTQVAGPGGTVFCGLPLFHVNAQIGTGLAIFAHGGHVLLGTPQGYRGPGLLANFWAICDHHRLTTFSGVPTVYSALLQHPRTGHRLDSLAFAVCGAAPLPVELFRRFQQETGIRIVEGYGLTEAGCVSSLNPPGSENRVGSIGVRMPWQPMRAVVLDALGGYMRDAAMDETGTLVVRGPNLFKGYLSDHHNQGLWIDIPDANGQAQRWLNTGDLGRQDADGYFWLTGRAKELIIRGGHNIDPKVIEEALCAHPAVALCAAVGRPDAHAGEVPVAYVQLREGNNATETELLTYAHSHIGERAAHPKAIRLLPALPVTAVGKIFKPTLSMREVASVVNEESNALGIALQSLQVVQDPKRGIVAQVAVATPERERMQTAMGRYAFGLDLTSN